MKQALSIEQIRGARSFLGLSQTEMATACSITTNTLSRIESGHTSTRAETMDSIVAFFDNEGIAFTPTGFFRRDNTLITIETESPYLDLLDDVHRTLKETGGEVLFVHISNRLSSEAVINKQLQMRATGIMFRALIKEGDTYCIYPLSEYRQIPKEFFDQNTMLIYGNKVGTIVTTATSKKAIIINNESYARTQRNMFELTWVTHKMPSETTAPEIYK